MADPRYVYRPRTPEVRAKLSVAHKRRLGIPDGFRRVYGIFVPEHFEPRLMNWASWLHQKRGREVAVEFVRNAVATGCVAKPSPDKKRSDWGLIEELLAEHMTRQEVADFLGIKLWYLQERLEIRHRTGLSEYGSGKRKRVKYDR